MKREEYYFPVSLIPYYILINFLASLVVGILFGVAYGSVIVGIIVGWIFFTFLLIIQLLLGLGAIKKMSFPQIILNN